MNPEMIKEMMNSEMAKEMAPKMMPEIMPEALNKFLPYIPEDKRKEFIAKIVDIIVSKDEKKEIYAEFLDMFETLLNIKGLIVHSRGGKGSVKEMVSPMDLFLAGLCGCICIAVGNTLKDNNIKAEVKVDGKVEKSFELGKITKVTLNIHVKVDGDVDKEKLKDIILEGSKKCLISNSLNCEVEKNVIFE
ncbi:OsmC family protein [Methanocaldococcus fervens]|uniref:OsmC family protein n=1 Tax=Methanocaldococcus fervens (strain DSM 4213 / JCM 15782 / AG86) TaxID=573064 RepID=C7P9D3_METFA|nr:OsmC family protein [Methanocaldococcus fervens]ACV25165.1 OsmC family protein [Methanocaldococcus fervens AG86]